MSVFMINKVRLITRICRSSCETSSKRRFTILSLCYVVTYLMKDSLIKHKSMIIVVHVCRLTDAVRCLALYWHLLPPPRSSYFRHSLSARVSVCWPVCVCKISKKLWINFCIFWSGMVGHGPTKKSVNFFAIRIPFPYLPPFSPP